MKTTAKPSKSKSDYTKSLEKVTQDTIPVSKFDNDKVNFSPGTVKDLKESTRKLDGNGILLQPHQARLLRGGNHLKNGGAGIKLG